MIDLGYILADIPDSDLVVLDEDNSGSISEKEFVDFFNEGMKFVDSSDIGPPPVPPVDDLLFKVDDNAGEVNVLVTTARELRKATTWFSNQGLVSNDPNSNPDNIEAITKPRYCYYYYFYYSTNTIITIPKILILLLILLLLGLLSSMTRN